MSRAPYHRTQVEKILAAYRDLFPDTSGELSKYWDTGRHREWSCLTTDFHLATYEHFADLHSRTEKINGNRSLGPYEKGEALRLASRATGVGFSLGVCPWTDNLLYETYSPDKSRLIILLGHDWYPIVPASGQNCGSPLAVEGLHYVNNYKPAAPQIIFTSDSPVVLFLNLYPDFRPPGSPTTGTLPKGSYSYEDCLRGLDTVIASLNPRFKSIDLISWGANTWKALGKRIEGKQKGIMAQARDHSGEVLLFNSGCRKTPYLPLAHPCFDSNFRRGFHLQHVSAGFAAMGLGAPGGVSKSGAAV